MRCPECGYAPTRADLHRIYCPSLLRVPPMSPPPPTLAEAVEVIEALLETADHNEGFAKARDFLKRARKAAGG